MKRSGILAIVILALAAGGAYAQALENSGGYQVVIPMQVSPSCPAATGAGPGAGTTCVAVPVRPGPCNPYVVESQCGTFCEAGQVATGWPYGWCDDYWLRPDSNF